MDEITVRLSVSGIVANNGMPFSIDQSFELDAEFQNLISFPDVMMTIAVLSFAWIQVNQEFSLTHGKIIQ